MTPNTRREGEAYDDYRKRLKEHNRDLRASLRGSFMWDSGGDIDPQTKEKRPGMTYRKDKHGPLPSEAAQLG